MAAKPSWPSLPAAYPPVNKVLDDQAAEEAPLLVDQAVHIETPLELRAEVTWPPSSIFSTQNNHDLGKCDLNSGGASGQVEQVEAKHVWPSLPVPHPSIYEVLEDQAAVEALVVIQHLLHPGQRDRRRNPQCLQEGH